MTDRRVEDGERLCRVQGDENPHQELLVFGLQGLSEAVDDAGGGDTKAKISTGSIRSMFISSQGTLRCTTSGAPPLRDGVTSSHPSFLLRGVLLHSLSPAWAGL